MRPALVILALAAVTGAACGSSPAPITVEAFSEGFGSGYCHRVYTCCASVDRSAVSPGTDEPSCAVGMIQNAMMNAQFLLGFTGVAYFAPAAARCLDVLRDDACASIFAPDGELIACQDVFAGTNALGATCEDPRQCASGACAGALCIAPAPCASGVPSEDQSACLPQVALGQSCQVSGQCPESSACANGVCVAQEPDGHPCQEIDECLGACGSPAPTTGLGVCRPAYCRGP